MSVAGRVDFPTHMKTIHQDWLNQTGSDSIEDSMVDKMNDALGGSPYSSMTAYDPATRLTAITNAVAAYNTLIDAMDYEVDWGDMVDKAVADADADIFGTTEVNAAVSAFGDELDDQIENIVLPRFQRGLQDVNAVMSSAFVIGESIIEGMRDRDVARFSADLSIKNYLQRNDFVIKGIEQMLKLHLFRIDGEKNVAHYTAEINRLGMIGEKEKKDSENLISVKDGKWDLEIFQYGANLLAAIGGGTLIPDASDPSGSSTGQSAMAGAVAGAGIGNAVGDGSPWWTAGGAIAGGLIGGLL